MVLAPKKFSAKLVRKWLRNDQNTFSRPEKGQKCGFWPQKNFQPNRSENCRNLTKRQFLGSKRVKNVVFGLKKFFSQISQKMAEIWPKDFSRPKEGQKCGFWPQKNFQPNLSKNGQNLAKRLFLGSKRVKNVVFGPEKIFSQISQKMAEKWPKYVF